MADGIVFFETILDITIETLHNHIQGFCCDVIKLVENGYGIDRECHKMLNSILGQAALYDGNYLHVFGMDVSHLHHLSISALNSLL